MFVRLHDPRLDGDVAGDQLRRHIAAGRIERREIIEHRGIPDGGVFDGLGEAFVKLAVRQRAQRFRIDDDQPRLVEGS